MKAIRTIKEARQALIKLDQELKEIGGQSSRVPAHLRYKYQELMQQAKRVNAIARTLQNG